MKGINTYGQRLREFVDSYDRESVNTIFCSDKRRPANWSDLVWYFKDTTLGTFHRYIFTCHVKGKKRSARDRKFQRELLEPSKLLSVVYEDLLKIYAIKVQGQSIVNNSKQFRVVVAATVLTEADRLGGIENIPIAFWDETKGSNLFWDFTRKQGLIPPGRRPVHSDRERGADDLAERSSGVLKMTPEHLIHALGGIFTTVFAGVDNQGHLKKGESIDVPDAVAITAVVLGLASPNRTSAEVPLLPNQLVKTIRPEIGEPVHYLDWPGSKGYADNQNHILSVLAPEVKKAIAFHFQLFKPERHLMRFYKDTSSGWESILKDFVVDEERKLRIDFSISPNLFSVAYALGFYPLEYKVAVIKKPQQDIQIYDDDHRRRWRFRRKWIPKLKRYTRRSDFYVKKLICDVDLDDVVINNIGTHEEDAEQSPYSVARLLNILGINESTRKILRLDSSGVLMSVKAVQDTIVKYQRSFFGNFPFDYCDGDKSVDMEQALFCICFSKHGFPSPKHNMGCNFLIFPLRKVKTHFVTAFSSGLVNGRENTRNIFYKYGYGMQKLRLHSLRHFANTNAVKGGIPLSVIASWSGRTSIKQTLEYIHTTAEEKAEKVISTLELEEDNKDIRVISSRNIANEGGLPASVTGTGVCVQELSVTPCDYINDFLSGCFGCESSCYVCGDLKAVELLEKDYYFQNVRLDRLMAERDQFLSEARKKWWVTHSIGVAVMGQLIEVLKTGKHGDLVRISADRRQIFITDKEKKAVVAKATRLPSEKMLLQELEQAEKTKDTEVPASMASILAIYGVGDN